MIVFISWLSFWLNNDERADRLNLCLTAVLTVTLFVVTVNENLPKVTYVKATDVYLLACFGFVFMALMGIRKDGYSREMVYAFNIFFQSM